MAASAPPPQQSFDPGMMYVWIKGVESKVNNLIREMNVLKNDFTRKASDLKNEVKVFNEDLLELKREQEKTMQNFNLVVKELKQTAGIEEVITLRKYIEFWNPMNFVTRRDLDRIMETKLMEAKENDDNR